MRLGRMLGATIDFILVGVDLKNHAAVASRKAAMLQRQAKFYATGRVKVGIRVACRVIGVGNNRITVEAVGVDSVISASALSWEWSPDVTDLYSTGDLVVARVMAIVQYEATGQFSVRLSVKAATENPDLPALRKLVPGSNYFGVVTGVYDRLIFVRLQAGANAKTKLYHTKQIPSKLDESQPLLAIHSRPREDLLNDRRIRILCLDVPDLTLDHLFWLRDPTITIFHCCLLSIDINHRSKCDC